MHRFCITFALLGIMQNIDLPGGKFNESTETLSFAVDWGAAVKRVPCPVKEGCKVRLDESLSYRSRRQAFRNHLERVHHVPLREVSGFLRTMLGNLYRPSPEYEISELPVWPDNITVQPERKAGEFLKAMEKPKGNLLRGNKLLPREKEPPSLKDLGIEKKESQRWQKIEIVE